MRPPQLFPEVATTSEWCQRWEGGRHTWRHRAETFHPARYNVVLVDTAVAKKFVTANHYSGSFPAARRSYGLYDGAALVGVAALSVPTRAEVLTNPFPDLEPYTESLELGRFVLADRVPANGESWFLARAFRLAADDGIRGVVAFSDPVPRVSAGAVLFPGHVGWVYQALNATYAGRATARRLMLLPDGTSLNDRSLQKVRAQERGHQHVERRLMALGASVPRAGETGARWLERALEAVGAGRVAHGGNHRYLFAVGPGRARRGARLAAAGAYPKVPESV